MKRPYLTKINYNFILIPALFLLATCAFLPAKLSAAGWHFGELKHLDVQVQWGGYTGHIDQNAYTPYFDMTEDTVINLNVRVTNTGNKTFNNYRVRARLIAIDDYTGQAYYTGGFVTITAGELLPYQNPNYSSTMPWEEARMEPGDTHVYGAVSGGSYIFDIGYMPVPAFGDTYQIGVLLDIQHINESGEEEAASFTSTRLNPATIVYPYY